MHTRKVAHLTSVHPRYDTRIFLKECMSLANHGFSVSLIVADGKGNEQKSNVAIYDVGASKGRLDRIRNAPGRVFKKAVALDADIYHFHDPELIPIGLKLKKLGKSVIFDSHEDVPKQILAKPYLNAVAKVFLSKAFMLYESYAVPRLDAIVAATPFIRDKFLPINKRSVDINNYPMIGELNADQNVGWDQKKSQVAYVGGITAVRGIREIVQALPLAKTDVRLQLGGRFSEPALEDEIKSEPGWRKVDELGWLDREQVAAVLRRSVAGLVTLHPAINYIDSLPVKMFEYMSAGIPVIASNFPLWREIIEGNDCGVCVDPLDAGAIAEAIDFVVANPKRARQMGQNGQRAVAERYNWAVEEKKLLALYSALLEQRC